MPTLVSAGGLNVLRQKMYSHLDLSSGFCQGDLSRRNVSVRFIGLELITANSVWPHSANECDQESQLLCNMKPVIVTQTYCALNRAKNSRHSVSVLFMAAGKELLWNCLSLSRARQSECWHLTRVGSICLRRVTTRPAVCGTWIVERSS